MKLKILLILLGYHPAESDATEPYLDRVERLGVMAEAIAGVSGADHQLAAFLAVQAHAESRLSRDAQSCECRFFSCDNGRAHGPWNLHRAPRQSAESWWGYCGFGLESVRSAAARQRQFYDPRDLVASFRRCGGSSVPKTAKWPHRRAAETQRVAAELRRTS